jgi:hypothetical protein
MIAGATLSNNQGVAIATNFTNAISSYTGTTLLTPLFGALGNSASANLTPTTLIGLETMAANSCPALADSTPEAYASNIGNYALAEQVRMLMDDYQNEINHRNQKLMDELSQKSDRFSGIINVK